MVEKEIVNELRSLEESLWESSTRFDRAYMERVLAPDFFEFGRSGRVYTREEILAAQGDKINARLRDFKVTAVSEDVFLVTYVSEVQYETLEVGNRSSLWLRTADGWQLTFHQGTKVTETSVFES
ncbi:MAG TPA: DUF4440 domain-containing protein [Anaerolineales bacterium]|nr:DUF4440 domain-containing protein [Anaerolineales bacterium]